MKFYLILFGNPNAEQKFRVAITKAKHYSQATATAKAIECHNDENTFAVCEVSEDDVSHLDVEFIQ